MRYFEQCSAPDGRSRSYTLRVNVGEQCQYDCGYCRPGSVRAHTAVAQRVQPSEYQRLAQLFAHVGVTKVRFTGGEPLLRSDIREVFAAFHRGLPSAHLALTTNGHRLSRLLDVPPEGLSAVTIHVDSLQPQRYRALMGGGDLGTTLDSAVRARKLGLTTKLNVVVQRGLNDDELPDFLKWSSNSGIEVRFIELMNTGSALEFARVHFLSGSEMLARLGAAHMVGRRNPSDPACLFRTNDGTQFGVIASDTTPFCQQCNRLRLSADGRLRGCMYEPEGAPLVELLRSGGSDELAIRLLAQTVALKHSCHPSRLLPRTHFSMADVGG